MAQVNIDIDEKSGGRLSASKQKSDSVEGAVKQEQSEEPFSIYISSDSETEDVAQSLALGSFLHGGGTDTENRTQCLALSSETAPVPSTLPISEDTASTWVSGYRGTNRVSKSSSVRNNYIPPPPSGDQTTMPPTTTHRHKLVAGPRLLPTLLVNRGFPQPLSAIAGLVQPPDTEPTPSSQFDLQFRPPVT